MIKTIPEPITGTAATKVLSRLKAHGRNLTWEINTELQGKAACNFTEQKISFRNEISSKDEGVILHELLHMDLYDRGYPILNSRVGDTYGVAMINDVFQHIAMSRELEEVAFSVRDDEVPAAARLIGALIIKTEALAENEELFSSALYIRGNWLGLEEAELLSLEEYIRSHNQRLNMDKISEAIAKLPTPDASLEQYEESIVEVLSILGIGDEVDFERSVALLSKE